MSRPGRHDVYATDGYTVDVVVEVRLGVRGLGRWLSTPMDPLHDLARGCRYRAKSREALEWASRYGWQDRPPHMEAPR